MSAEHVSDAIRYDPLTGLQPFDGTALDEDKPRLRLHRLCGECFVAAPVAGNLQPRNFDADHSMTPTGKDFVRLTAKGVSTYFGLSRCGG